MLGALGWASLGVLKRPRSLRFKSLVYHLYQVGWRAIPIIALVTFLIGAIIAQQGIFHFRKFGAESYVVDLVGILVLREIGVLIVAIMVAGRSGLRLIFNGAGKKPSPRPWSGLFHECRTKHHGIEQSETSRN